MNGSVGLSILLLAYFLPEAVAAKDVSTSTPLDDGAWTYPSLTQVLDAGPGVVIDVDIVLDCTVTRQGRIKACDNINSGEAANEAANKVIARAYVRHARVDPNSVAGGIQDKARKRFTYTYSDLTHSDLAGADALSVVPAEMKARYAQAKWDGVLTIQNVGYPRRAFNEGKNGSAIADCAIQVTGDLGPCTVVAESPAGYDFGAQAVYDFTHFSHIIPDSVPGGIQPGDHFVQRLSWNLG